MGIFGLFFSSPYWLFWIIVVFVLAFFLFKAPVVAPFSFFDELKKIYKVHSIWFWSKQFLLLLFFLVLFISLARPYTLNNKEKIKKDGIDIVLVVDVSMSMEAVDLQPNRMQAAKKILLKFLGKVASDRVWLVVFAGKPFTSVPLTFDYQIVNGALSDISTEIINQQVPGMWSTAIGDAILSAVQQFDVYQEEKNTKNKKKREKIIILLTDGEANSWIDPKLAAKLVQEKWIKIYTIWIGSLGGGYIEQKTVFGIRKVPVSGVDEESLKELSKVTWWKYFRAIDNKTFERIWQEIAKLPKQEIEVESYIVHVSLLKNFLFIMILLLGWYIVLFVFFPWEV